MAYIANTAEDVRAMLDAIGISDVEELFRDTPKGLKLAEPPGPAALSEYETLRLMGERAALNRPAATAYRNFIGAGAYEHFIPSAVQAIAQRGELLTAYTPYQAEASQGTLQIIYEFQSMICALTAMEASNASMYDGASALAEAVLMAVRITKRTRIVLPETLHPSYRRVVESYTKNLGIELLTWGANKEAGGAVTDPGAWPAEASEVAAAVIATPNFYGFIEPARDLAAVAKEHGALVISTGNPMSLSLLEPPGAWGADIAVGELQPLGLPLNYGGPYAGFMTTLKKHIRKMPGRIVGRAHDGQGREGFVLTLQTREQHIRRERATSNICTNQGLCVTMVTLWLALIGKRGFEQIGDVNAERAGQLMEALTGLPGVELIARRPFFNEFTLELPIEAETFVRLMRGEGVLPGLPVTSLGLPHPNRLIVCATETKLDSDIEHYVTAAKKVLE